MAEQCGLAGAGAAHDRQDGRSLAEKEVTESAALHEVLAGLRKRPDSDLLRGPGHHGDIYEDLVQFRRERPAGGQALEIDKPKSGQDGPAVLQLKSRDLALKE